MVAVYKFPVSRLHEETLKLGEYKLLGDVPVSKANFVLSHGFIHGIPTSIEQDGVLSLTKDRTTDAVGRFINYRIEIPQEAVDAVVQFLSSVNLVGGKNPWVSQYFLLVTVSDRCIIEEGGESITIRSFYRSLQIVKENNQVVCSHKTKGRRGKNRKDYN